GNAASWPSTRRSATAMRTMPTSTLTTNPTRPSRPANAGAVFCAPACRALGMAETMIVTMNTPMMNPTFCLTRLQPVVSAVSIEKLAVMRTPLAVNLSASIQRGNPYGVDQTADARYFTSQVWTKYVGGLIGLPGDAPTTRLRTKYGYG